MTVRRIVGPARAGVRPAGRVSPAYLAAVGLLLAGCAQQVGAGDRVVPSQSGATAIAERGYTSADGATTIVARSQREPAGDLSGPTLDGSTFKLSDLRGQVVVVNVWASWCGPCRAEAADLVTVSKDLSKSGVSFVGVNLKDSPDAARAFVRRFGIEYPSVIDRDGTKVLALSADLPPTAVPATLVIDQEGKVAARGLGRVDRSRLLAMIEPVMAEEQPDSPGASSTRAAE